MSKQPGPLAAITPEGIVLGNPTDSKIQHLGDLVSSNEIACALLDIIATGKGGILPVRSLGPLWEARWFDIHVTPWHQNVYGLIETYLIVPHDVTALKLPGAVTAMLHDEDAPFAVIYTDALEQLGRIVGWFGACSRWFGYLADEVRGRDITIVKHDEDIQLVRAGSTNGRVCQRFLRYRHKNGTTRWCHGTIKECGAYRVGVIELAETRIRDAVALLNVLGDVLKTDPAVPPSAPMSARDLLRFAGLPYNERSLDRLEKRLKRLRERDDSCYVDVQNRERNKPSFLYYYHKVKHVLDDLKRRSPESPPS